MEIVTGISLAVLIITAAMGVYVLHSEREMKKIKRRTRQLNERLEAVEKFNGLNQTNTDIRVLKS